MEKRNNNFEFDFMPIGQGIKEAREAKDITREQLAGMIGYAPRHIQAVENEGQLPSVELLIQLAETLDVSLDKYIFRDKSSAKSSIRRRVERLLDGLEDKDLIIIEATAKGIHTAKGQM